MNHDTTHVPNQELSAFMDTLEPGRPVLLVDADEVILRFVDTLMEHLPTKGAKLGTNGFRLFGNVHCMTTGRAYSNDEISTLLDSVWIERAHNMDVVPGASDALASLAHEWQVAILTNIPAEHRSARSRNLLRHGIPYPVIANAEGKGPAVRKILDHAKAPVAFVDDLPNQHASVAQHAPDVRRVHYVFHPEFAKMIGKAEDAHIRLDHWADIHSHLTDWLQSGGER